MEKRAGAGALVIDRPYVLMNQTALMSRAFWIGTPRKNMGPAIIHPV